MTETQLLTISASLVAAMFGLLCTVLAWIGSKMYAKLDEVVKALGTVKDELHERITDTERRHNEVIIIHDRRISKLETRCDMQHGEK